MHKATEQVIMNKRVLKIAEAESEKNRMRNGLGKQWKWRAALLMAALMLLCGSHALAESMNKVPAERIQSVTPPEGIVTIGEPVIADGKVTVRVDDDKTNWTEVLMKGASREQLHTFLTISVPDGMTKGTRENFGALDKETLAGIEQGVAPGWFADYETYPLEDGVMDGSAIFAEILFDETTYVRPEAATGAGTVICWENDSGKRQFEYVQWEIIHSDSSLREVYMPALPLKMLSSVSDALPKGVTAEIETGGVTCTVKSFSLLSSLPIVINAPEGATEAVVYSSNEGKSTKKRLPVEDGKVQLTITPESHSTFAFDHKIGPAQLDYTIAFVSGEEPEEELHDFGLLTVWLLAAEKAPYPYYNEQKVKPVANDRLTIWQGKQKVSNEAIYQEEYGDAHLTQEALVFSEADSGNIRMDVAAPVWAVEYAISGSASDFIYQTNWILELGTEKHPVSSGKDKYVTVYDQPLFKTVQAGRALVYLQDGVTARYGGNVYVISWYDKHNGTVPRLMEYLVITHDEFGEEVFNPVKATEEQIDEPVSEVTAVSQNDWQLVVRYDPQSGDRAIHYDLHMEDDRSVSYNLDGETVFYIPYPDGHSYEDMDVTYQLYHYSQNYQSYVTVPLTPTPYGLRFVEDHLSPFVLMWDDPAQEPEPTIPTETDVPRTGDDTPVEWLLTLLVGSLAAFAYMLRRKRSV